MRNDSRVHVNLVKNITEGVNHCGESCCSLAKAVNVCSWLATDPVFGLLFQALNEKQRGFARSQQTGRQLAFPVDTAKLILSRSSQSRIPDIPEPDWLMRLAFPGAL